MSFKITHGNRFAVSTIPRRSADSAFRAVSDLLDEGVPILKIEDPDGRVLSVGELADLYTKDWR